jgi:hypothetical protein
MLDPTTHQRAEFRAGTPICLADGQTWILPSPNPEQGSDEVYEALISSIVMADDRRELLRAELALGIRLILTNYDLPPLLLGAMLDFPEGDPELPRFQTTLHLLSLEHVRAFRPPNEIPLPSVPAPRFHRPSRRFGFFNRTGTSVSA